MTVAAACAARGISGGRGGLRYDGRKLRPAAVFHKAQPGMHKRFFLRLSVCAAVALDFSVLAVFGSFKNGFAFSPSADDFCCCAQQVPAIFGCGTARCVIVNPRQRTGSVNIMQVLYLTGFAN